FNRLLQPTSPVILYPLYLDCLSGNQQLYAQLFPMKRPNVIYKQSDMNFPVVDDIYTIVPIPFTQEVPAPAGSSEHPNALRLVRYVGGIPPPLPSNPFTFTAPGHTYQDARDFVHAMQGTVRWTEQKQKHNIINSSPTTIKAGRPAAVSFKLEFKCPCAGFSKREIGSRKTHTLMKRGCPARFTISHHLLTNTLRVFWLWEHNHDPFSPEEMVTCRTPKAVEKWLNDRVVSGLSWNSIERLLQSPDLFGDQLDSSIAIPEASRDMYDKVRYLIRKRIKVLSIRASNVFESIVLWNTQLIQAGWYTYLPFPDNPASINYLYAFQSPWQRKMLLSHGQSLMMLDSTHNSVSNYCFHDGRKVSLYTIVIRDPVTGKGLPVCWAFTASEAAEPIEMILRWLRLTSGLIPQAIMSDCALAITNAVCDVYDDLGAQGPKHYWCLFHVIKAYKGVAGRYLPARAEEAVSDFRRLVYCCLPNPEARWMTFVTKWKSVSPGFGKYLKDQWYSNYNHWAMYYRTTAHRGVHTNNYTESWHHILKSKFISGTKRRMDVVIQIFKDEVLPRYRKESAVVEMGFRKQRTNKFQHHAKVLGESYSKQFMAEIGVAITARPTHFDVTSFTRPTMASYVVAIKRGGGCNKAKLTGCTCSHFARYGSACKHMYWIAKAHSLLVVERVAAITQHEYPRGPTGEEIIPLMPILVGSDTEEVQADSDVEVLHRKGLLPGPQTVPSVSILAEADTDEVQADSDVEVLHQRVCPPSPAPLLTWPCCRALPFTYPTLNTFTDPLLTS
ncbi:hypothetical protein MJO28_015050, partial [Puccinia striiformis f. sp. tritici]